MYTKLDSPISLVPGIGPKKEKLYLKLGVRTINDLLKHYPHRYEDRRFFKKISQVNIEEKICIEAVVISLDIKKHKKNMIITKIIVNDMTQNAILVYFNNSFIHKNIKLGMTIKIYGTAVRINGIVNINSPEIDYEDQNKKTGILYPIYPLTRGLFNDEVIKSIKWILNNINLKELEYLSAEYRQKLRLCELDDAISNIHFPKEPLHVKVAKFRLVFDEFFLLNMGLANIKVSTLREKGIQFKSEEKENVLLEKFIDNLPFKLTEAQCNVINDIIKDMTNEYPMQRLVQGDVGSGKTVIAMTASYFAYLNAYQTTLMAPTEILAKQHYQSFVKTFENTGANIQLITGSTSQKSKKEIYNLLETGECNIIIGTHALIEDKVKYKNIGLVITDEQHRFGVRQRSKLLQKSEVQPDMIVMTATPIPRTLAYIIHGDLDISIINQMPLGRKPIITMAYKKNDTLTVYNFAKKQIESNRQVYIVCPLVEESEKLDIQAATQLYEHLSEDIFKGYSIALLHGKMKSKEKEIIMDKFSNNEIKVLVSTTVIEVGVNVPNASMMIVQDSQRFGLSQLHQLRGRVGRGEYQSYCALIYDGKGKTIEQRINIMKISNDGFEISQKDLEIRGPGEYFGTKQHGLDNFSLADITKHISILNLAKEFVDFIIKDDPKLVKCNNLLIKREIDKSLEKLMY